jgi:glyoxylase-like metal-dependent hydrolase (beta-lactamase superfamily II)
MWQFPGWWKIGEFESGVGSWLLVNNGEAMLLEVPEGLKVEHIERALEQIGLPMLRAIGTSHSHEDHLDENTWRLIKHRWWPIPYVVDPRDYQGPLIFDLGGEKLFVRYAPKHSYDDIIVIFRGVCFTGDIELGTLDSVNREVNLPTKRKTMRNLATFEEDANYKVHTTHSAHCNDTRTNVDWKSLFMVKE